MYPIKQHFKDSVLTNDAAPRINAYAICCVLPIASKACRHPTSIDEVGEKLETRTAILEHEVLADSIDGSPLF